MIWKLRVLRKSSEFPNEVADCWVPVLEECICSLSLAEHRNLYIRIRVEVYRKFSKFSYHHRHMCTLSYTAEFWWSLKKASEIRKVLCRYYEGTHSIVCRVGRQLMHIDIWKNVAFRICPGYVGYPCTAARRFSHCCLGVEWFQTVYSTVFAFDTVLRIWDPIMVRESSMLRSAFFCGKIETDAEGVFSIHWFWILG